MKRHIKKIYNIIITACILFSLQVYIFAQDAETKAQVEFEAGEGPTVPVHPEDPDVDSNVDGVEGSLAIVSVSDFNFGDELPVEAVTRLYDIQTSMPNIQVVDLRGTGAGWRVSAQVSEFTSGGGTPSLPGASIFIYKGRPNSLSISDPPIQKQSVKLTTDGETILVLEAPKGAGTGLWIMRWYPPLYDPEDVTESETENVARAYTIDEETEAYIQLEIPAGTATVGNHTATINWILENTPSE